MMRRRAWLVVLALGVAMPCAAAADLRPSWECLPADTAFMVRVPGLAEFWKMIQARTKFGSVALSPKRLEGLWQTLATIQGDDDEEWSLEKFEESLRKYGLETSDLARVFDAECGAGVVAHQEQGMLLAWIEPGEEVSAKLLAAIQQRVEEDDSGEESRTKRLDVELAGHSVTVLVHPLMELDMDELPMDLPDDEDADASLERRIEGIRKRVQAAEFKQVGERHTLLAVLGGRLLIGDTKFKADPADGGDAVARETEELRRIYATFLDTHAGSGEPALAAVLREPAIAAASLPGLPLVEIVFVPKALIAMAETADREVRTNLATAGLDDLGGMVMRHAFDDGRWRAVMAMTLPSPRHGLLEILDQPCDASDVPPFVTRETADFTQLSLDLGAAYKTIRQVLLAQAQGEQIANMFSVADTQSQAWLNVDVATVLSGLGSRHWILTFPPQVAEAMAKARAAEEKGDESIKLADRLAVVWQVADDAPYLKLVGRLAQLAGGQLEEEQGFQGVRIPGGAAFYVGRGHLVVAIGEGTLEKTLAAIRTPPQGDAALRESNVPRRAAELVQVRPARVFGVSDSTRTGGTIGMLRDLAAAMEPDDIDDEKMRGVFVALKDLLPTAREMEGMFGIGATLMRMTDDGMLYETAWEMPAP
jgi:hypothetical protein